MKDTAALVGKSSYFDSKQKIILPTSQGIHLAGCNKALYQTWRGKQKKPPYARIIISGENSAMRWLHLEFRLAKHESRAIAERTWTNKQCSRRMLVHLNTEIPSSAPCSRPNRGKLSHNIESKRILGYKFRNSVTSLSICDLLYWHFLRSVFFFVQYIRNGNKLLTETRHCNTGFSGNVPRTVRNV